MTAPLIELKNVVVRRSGRNILDALSLQAQPSELLALVGPNGSGKSTALRIMAGALPADAGSIFYDGQHAAELDPLARSRFVAYLPQDFTSHWDLTVTELLRLGATRGDGFGWLEALHRTEGVPTQLMHDFELDNLMARRLSTLSGGERARAALASTVAGHPRLLLADEPVSSLDIAHQLRTLRHLSAMKAQTATLVVLHDLNLAGRFADRIAVLDRGRCVLHGPVTAVLESTLLDDVFETRFERHAAPWGPLLIPK